MSKFRVHCFGVSLDGYGAGPHQNLENPLGVRGEGLHRWQFATPTFKRVHESFFTVDGEAGLAGIDDGFVARGFENIGAWIIGRNMFGPSRGPWPKDDWKGWWGGNPPFHTPVFVLTNYKRPSIEMEGGTVFHFVTDGLDAAIEKSKQSARGQDVRVGGGVSLVRQCLSARCIDEMHFAISPVFLGSGEPLFQNVDLNKTGYTCAEYLPSEKVTHVVIRKA